MDIEFTTRWSKVEEMVEKRFGEKLDEQSVLFIIGLQELGKGEKEYDKNEKIDIIHIGICAVLCKLGYYQFVGKDDDGWPHYENIKKLPIDLKDASQEMFLKKAIITYFNLQ